MKNKEVFCYRQNQVHTDKLNIKTSLFFYFSLVCYSFRSGANFEPLSVSLQNGVHFFSHLLPSRGFRLCCLRPTHWFDLPLRLCRVYPVVSYGFSKMVRMASSSGIGILFPHLNGSVTLGLPIYLLVIACQDSFGYFWDHPVYSLA